MIMTVNFQLTKTIFTNNTDEGKFMRVIIINYMKTPVSDYLTTILK